MIHFSFLIRFGTIGRVCVARCPPRGGCSCKAAPPVGEETPPERNQSGVILLGNVDQVALFRDTEVREGLIQVACGQRGTIQLGLAGGVIDIMSFQDGAQGGVGVNGVGVAVQVIDDSDVNHGENLLMMKYFYIGLWIGKEKSWPGCLLWG